MWGSGAEPGNQAHPFARYSCFAFVLCWRKPARIALPHEQTTDSDVPPNLLINQTPPRESSGDAGGVGGTATGTAPTLTESIVGMYIPTPADLALRAAAAGLVASVLGRVKEFTTLFAQVSDC